MINCNMDTDSMTLTLVNDCNTELEISVDLAGTVEFDGSEYAPGVKDLDALLEAMALDMWELRYFEVWFGSSECDRLAGLDDILYGKEVMFIEEVARQRIELNLLLINRSEASERKEMFRTLLGFVENDITYWHNRLTYKSLSLQREGAGPAEGL